MDTRTKSALISCKTAEHYTPSKHVEAARKVLEHIDLDPASSEEANEVVKADKFYTADDDGLSLPWHGRVFLNPPGDVAGKLVKAFWRKACQHAQDGGVVLWVGFSVEHLQSLQNGVDEIAPGIRCPHPLEFPTVVSRKRISWRPTREAKQALDAENAERKRLKLPKKTNSPPHGNYFTLLGGGKPERTRFLEEFGPLGQVTRGRRPVRVRNIQAEILESLTIDGPTRSKSAIARRISARKATVIKTIDRMVEEGVISRSHGYICVEAS